MTQQPTIGDGSCLHCGSVMRAGAPFCRACGQAVTNRQRPLTPSGSTTSLNPVPVPAAVPPAPPPPGQIVGAGRGVRCAAYLLDVAAALSPALPLGVASVVLGVPEVVYVVLPVAFVAVLVWMQVWQSCTGMTFGKSMLGLRLITVADGGVPGLSATVTRSAVFVVTAGLAALPVLLSPAPRLGAHDRASALMVIDVVSGANPLGPRLPQATLRRAKVRGLNRVHSPVPVPAVGRR